MKKANILIQLFLIFSTTQGQIVSVKQDSTGDFIHIQNAVTAAENGDTVLVWPGRYYENVDLQGKSISIGSRFLTTGDKSYKYSTIIDGNQIGTCILAIDCEYLVVAGFTLTNGSGYLSPGLWEGLTYGGGAYIRESKILLDNCVVSYNKTNTSSGGVQLYKSNVYLKGTSIFKNHSNGVGGGVLFLQSDVLFDDIDKCNIYSNSASNGCDIGADDFYPPINIILDTFTVLYPTRYFAEAVDSQGFPIDGFFSYDIQNSIINPHNGDLYVNPIFGNDTNSGLSNNEPLKTIFHALSFIAEDSVNKNTIYLADGIYSDSSNNEKFPLNTRSNVRIKGQSMENTILDGRNNSRIIKANNITSGFLYKNLKIQRGKYTDMPGAEGFLFYYGCQDFVLDSIILTQHIGDVAGSILGCHNFKIENFEVFNNTTQRSALQISLNTHGIYDNDFTVSNSKFYANKAYTEDDWYIGGGLEFSGDSHWEMSDNFPVVINCLIEGNLRTGLRTEGLSKIYLVNSTIVNNGSFDDIYSNRFTWGIDAQIFNTIFYNNGDNELYISNWDTDDTAYVEIYNSLIEGGEDNILVAQNGYLNYDETNIDEDPVFLNMWEHPFMISDGSPCIDAGTLELPDFIEIPEFDLAGNPRIVGGKIDMGAYEWNPTLVDIKDIGPDFIKKEQLLQAFPNPFESETNIEFMAKLQGENEYDITIEVFDNYGRKVKQLLTSRIGVNNDIIKWNGCDNNGKSLPQGIYYVVLFSNNNEIESLKLVKR